MTDTRMTRGGSGSHWQGCEARHWDCKIKRLEDTLAQVRADHAAIAAELRAKDAEIERLREALRNIADVPACSPDGQLYYEISSEDGQTGVMPVDPIGWIQDAANKARAALTPAAGDDHE